MFKRLLVILALIIIPAGVLADDAAPATDPAAATDTATPAPAASSNTASPDTATSAGLGPQTSPGSAGGSNADATALQPAGLAPVQSATGDSAGLGAPSGALQAPAATSDQLKVLSGEADGAPHELDDSSANSWGWLLIGLALALLAGLAVVARDRRRFARVTY